MGDRANHAFSLNRLTRLGVVFIAHWGACMVSAYCQSTMSSQRRFRVSVAWRSVLVSEMEPGQGSSGSPHGAETEIP